MFFSPSYWKDAFPYEIDLKDSSWWEASPPCPALPVQLCDKRDSITLKGREYNIWGSQCGVSRDWGCFHERGLWVRVRIQKLETFAEIQSHQENRLETLSAWSLWPNIELDAGEITSQWHQRSLSWGFYLSHPVDLFAVFFSLLHHPIAPSGIDPPSLFKDLSGDWWSQPFLFLNLPFGVRLPCGPHATLANRHALLGP